MENDPVLFEDEYVTQQLLSASIVEAAQVPYLRKLASLYRLHLNRKHATFIVVFCKLFLLRLETYS